MSYMYLYRVYIYTLYICAAKIFIRKLLFLICDLRNVYLQCVSLGE